MFLLKVIKGMFLLKAFKKVSLCDFFLNSIIDYPGLALTYFLVRSKFVI